MIASVRSVEIKLRSWDCDSKVVQVVQYEEYFWFNLWL